MKVIFSLRAYTSILAETTERIKTETGGLLLGTIEGDTWYVIESIDPGPNSVFEVAYFEYDQKYTQHLINKIANLYQEKLSLIGLWHRHPGSFDVFSGTDDGTNAKYASMRPEGAISGIVNIDPKFRLTLYHVKHPCDYSPVQYEVGDHLIPGNLLSYKTIHNFETLINGTVHSGENDRGWTPTLSLSSFMRVIKPFLGKRRYVKKLEKPAEDKEAVLDQIVNTVLSDILFLSDQLGIKMSVIRNGACVAFVQDTIDGIFRIFFAYSQEDDVFYFQYEKENYTYEDSLFKNTYELAEKTRKIENNHAEPDADPFALDVNDIVSDVLKLFRFQRKGR